MAIAIIKWLVGNIAWAIKIWHIKRTTAKTRRFTHIILVIAACICMHTKDSKCLIKIYQEVGIQLMRVAEVLCHRASTCITIVYTVWRNIGQIKAVTIARYLPLYAQP